MQINTDYVTRVTAVVPDGQAITFINLALIAASERYRVLPSEIIGPFKHRDAVRARHALAEVLRRHIGQTYTQNIGVVRLYVERDGRPERPVSHPSLAWIFRCEQSTFGRPTKTPPSEQDITDLDDIVTSAWERVRESGLSLLIG